jgi:hypothetical protein
LGSAIAADRMSEAAPAEALAGRWDLTIQDANRKPLPSWLELKADQGVWKANFVGRWGNARPLPRVVVQGDQIQFVSPKQEEDSRNDLVFVGKLTGETLTGSARGPNGTHWTWTGRRAPPLRPPASVRWLEPITLFNGRFVTVIQNGQTIINRQEIPGITGGAFDSHEELPGPIYLQGDHGGIAYRNLVLTPGAP